MLTILFLPLLTQLQSPDWRTREDAQRHLESHGWLAAPALWAGMASDVPEVAERCSVAFERLPTLGVILGRLVDRSGKWDRPEPAWSWAKRLPHLHGDAAGDLRYAAGHVRR